MCYCCITVNRWLDAYYTIVKQVKVRYKLYYKRGSVLYYLYRALCLKITEGGDTGVILHDYPLAASADKTLQWG